MTTPRFYAAGSNTPGYLPDGPPFYTDDYDAAKYYIIHELKFCEEYADSEEAAENFAEAAEDVNLWSGPDSITVDDAPDSEHSLGLSFWITEITEEEYAENADADNA